MNKVKAAIVPAIVVAVLLILLVGTNFEQVRAEGNYYPIVAIQTPLPCYGPSICANISSNYVNLGENVTITGHISPPASNCTVRITFTRPDYYWIDQYVLTDPVTGEFNCSQQLDMVGYWNIFPIRDHISDRLYAYVTDPANPDAPVPTTRPLPPFKTNIAVFAGAVVILTIGITALIVGRRNKTRKISGLRLLVQVAMICVIFFGIFIDHQNIPVPAEQIAPHEFLIGGSLLEILPDGVPLPVFGCWYPCGRTVTCPLWPLQTYIYPFWDAGHGWGVDYVLPGLERIAIVLGIVIIASVILGRFWCGWICPFGIYLDLISRIRKALGIRHRSFSPSFNEKFHQLGYVILALIFIVCIIFGSQAIAGTQLVSGTESGGFVNTYFSAPFCQVCPMKPLCILSQISTGTIRSEWTIGTTTGDFWQLGQYVTSLNMAILAIVTLAAFFFRRSWCRICPLGALIALFNRYPPFKWISGVKLEKVEEKCTKCGVCKRVCPTQVTEVYEKKGGDVTSAKCLLCLRCVEMCPYEDCLKFKFAGKSVCKSRNWLDIRAGEKQTNNDYP